MKTGWQNHVKLDNYLDECGLLDQILDGIDKFPADGFVKDRALEEMSKWSMGLITKSTHVAGKCQYSKNVIQLHKELLKPGREKDRNNTLLHEVGHFLARHLINDYYVPSHGRWWKYIISLIGGKPTRCHNYEYFKDLQISKAKHEYTCLDCGEKFYTQRILKNIERRHHSPCRYKENKGHLKHRVLR